MQTHGTLGRGVVVKHQIIYADPPWTYRDKCHSGERGAGYKYDLMTLDELCAMRPFIDSIAAADCLLAMWWVPPQPAEALRLVEAWGFEFKTMKGFSWFKQSKHGKHGKEFIGMGSLTRANSEDCLFALRGKPKRVSCGVRSVIDELGLDYDPVIKAPVREHSRKPDEARERLVQLMGDVPRIELFARERVPGWECMGNAVEQFTPVMAEVSRETRDTAVETTAIPGPKFNLEAHAH